MNIKPEQMSKDDKNLAEDLNFNIFNFPVKDKNSNKTNRQNNICSTVF